MSHKYVFLTLVIVYICGYGQRLCMQRHVSKLFQGANGLRFLVSVWKEKDGTVTPTPCPRESIGQLNPFPAEGKEKGESCDHFS